MAAEHVERTGLRVAERRKELGLTQHQLAERLPEASIDGQRISKWERGINSPSPDNLEALALALETDVADLVSGPTGERGETPDLPGGSQLDRIGRRCRLVYTAKGPAGDDPGQRAGRVAFVPARAVAPKGA